MAWAINGTPDTLGGTADVLTISDLDAKLLNVFLLHTISAANIIANLTTNSIVNTDYAQRNSTNGTGDQLGIDQTALLMASGLIQASDKFYMIYFINIDGEEKLMINHTIDRGNAGAGNAPLRNEFTGKIDNTTSSVRFTSIDVTNLGTGDYDTDSNLSALGTD